MKSTVYISASADAIDICLVSKDQVVNDFLKTSVFTTSEIACIGDSENDIPFLTIDNLGLVGTPLNGSDSLKKIIKKIAPHYIGMTGFFSGFGEFYDRCVKMGIRHVFTDRDGVLLHNNQLHYKQEIYDLFYNMGSPMNPVVSVLTGSSVQQNIWFIKNFNIDRAIKNNRFVNAASFYAENGAVVLDCITLESKINKAIVDLDYLKILREKVFLPTLKSIEAELFFKYKISFSNDERDQADKIYIPPKCTMFTINLPETLGVTEENRQSKLMKNLKNDIVDIIIRYSDMSDINYKLL